MISKRPKEKIRELVEMADTAEEKTVRRLHNQIRNNKTISEHAKHLPVKRD